jgi:hypothetical protein
MHISLSYQNWADFMRFYFRQEYAVSYVLYGLFIIIFYHPFPLIWLVLPPSTDDPEMVWTVEDELDEMGVVRMVVGVPGLVGGITFTNGITEYDCSPLGYNIPGFPPFPPPPSVDWLIPPDEIPEVIECWSSLWRCFIWEISCWFFNN